MDELDTLYSFFAEYNLIYVKIILDGTLPANDMVTILSEHEALTVEEVRSKLVKASPLLALSLARHASRQVIDTYHVTTVI